LHICFVEVGYPRPSGIVGGAGTYVKNYGKQLVKMGHEVTVICGRMDNGTDFFRDDGISVFPIICPNVAAYYLSRIPFFRIYSKAFNYIFTGLKTYLFLKILNSKNKIDLVEYSEGGDFWNSITKKFRYISNLHGSAYTFKQNSGQGANRTDLVHRKLEHYFIKKAEKVIVQCKAMAHMIENEMGHKLKVHVIPYPIDGKYFKLIQHNNINLNKGKISVLFASRNDKVKGGELFVNCLKQLDNEYKSIIGVDFFGYKPDQDVSNLDFLTLHDFVPKNKLKLAYEKTDICVVPSFFDISPNTVYEAMASGKIIVASAVGGIPEIVNEPQNGFLFNKCDLDDFTKKLTKAIDLVLSGNDIQLRKNAQEKIMSISNIEKNVQKRLKLLQE